MKKFIFTAIFLLVAGQAMADFSAHILREKDSVMPVVSVDIPGSVFQSDMMTAPLTEFATSIGQEVNTERNAHYGPFGLYKQITEQHSTKAAAIVLAFEAHPDAATVAVVVEGNVDNLDAVLSGGSGFNYEFSLNSGEWTPYAFIPGQEEAMMQWNTPVDHRNPHLDLRGVASEKKLVSFKGPIDNMTRAPVAILCFDADGKLIKDGVRRSDWQHSVVYRGKDRFETPSDLVFGYTLVQHNGVGNLGFIFNEKATPMIDAPVSYIPSKKESGVATSEVHVGLVVNEPQIIQFGAWTKGIGAKIKILDEARKEIWAGKVATEKSGLTVLDIPFATSGLHKVIFCFQKDPNFSGDNDPIHLFIRKQGDAHLRPFTVQDSIIMD
jgi:hypothetical protein